MSTFGLVFVVFLASFLQVATGFGFSVIAAPFLLVIFESHDAIQLNIILALLISLIMIFKIYNEVNKELLKRLIKGSLIGILPGLLLFIFLDVRPLKILVSILVLVSTGLLIAKINIKQNNTKELVIGGLSGLLTTSIGVSGPPLMIYFSGAKIKKETLRSTMLAYFLFVYSVSIVLQLLMYGITKVVFTSTLLAIPFILLGINLAQLVFKRLNQQIFQKIIYVLLFLSGIYLLFTTL